MDTSFENLPELVLTIIAKYLNTEDLLNLTDSHENFKFLRPHLPKHLNLHYANFCRKFGESTSFRSPVMMQKVKSMTITYKLRTLHRFLPVLDESLIMCLVRKDEVIDTEIISSNPPYTQCVPLHMDSGRYGAITSLY